VLAPLKAAQVYSACQSSFFKFEDTRQIKPSDEIISQDAAVRAIDVGLGIRKPGYNIYVSGYSGSGKTGVIQNFVERFAKKLREPNDWIYVFDFQKRDTPRAIQLRTGEGHHFVQLMDNFIEALRQQIPYALQSEDYERTVNTILSRSSEKQAKKYSELEKIAKRMNFQLKSTTMGIETIPLFNNRALTEREYTRLSDKEKSQIESKRSVLEPIVLKYARKIRTMELKTKELLHDLEKEIGRRMVEAAIEPLTKACIKYQDLTEYLGQVRDYIIENLSDFVNQEEQKVDLDASLLTERDKFAKYKVNLFVDNQKTKYAPVFLESNPTYYNLFGKIERSVEHGMYTTDFTKIKSGSIQKANGGYLILDVQDVLKMPYVWESLKRVLRNREAYIEELDEHLALIPASALRPQPIPLDLKVIMMGSDEIYHLLFSMDEDFQKIFKIKADFDYKMSRSKENIHSYVNFIATRCHKENLLHLDGSGVSAIIEHSSRLVGDQTMLTTEFSKIKDIIIEADFVAREQKQRIVKRSHVERALEQKFYRVNLFERHLMDMVKTKDIMVSIEGQRIGQVNGLSVYDFGDHSFGRVCRITCTTSISDNGIFNIDRASKLSGKIHDKGMYILSGFLTALLARQQSLGVSASLCFEQSYDMIDGDSATASELIAVISALSEIPVRQNIAVTGSLNQLGDIQPVGGINEKIEGFYRTCKTLGKGKTYKVIMPIQNKTNLMLDKETRQAIAKGFLKIYPVRYFWEAFEIATGVSFGAKTVHEKKFIIGSALDVISKKLVRLSKKKTVVDEKTEKPAEHIPHAASRKRIAKKHVKSSRKDTSSSQ
jgi:lon-related putative ATP-dependent protease